MKRFFIAGAVCALALFCYSASSAEEVCEECVVPDDYLYQPGEENVYIGQAPDGYSFQPQSGYQYQPVSGSYANNSGDLETRVADLEAIMARKADKPAPTKGFSAPKIGGRFFIDFYSVMNQNDESYTAYTNAKNDLRFRDVRLTFTGTGYDFLDYKAEFGFDGSNKNRNDVAIRDLFLGIKNVPVFGYVRVGNQYVEDAGSEVANGTTNYTFMEAPAPNSSMFTSRRVGITSRHMFAKDNARLFFGIYDAEDISASHSSVKDKQNIILNARFTHSPWFCNDGRQMFLYGGYYAYTHNFEGSKGIKPGNWNVGYSVFDTGTITTDGMHKAGFELVYQDGPLCLQSDWYVQQFSGVDQVGGDDRTNYGGFLMASYFLTGDYRKYNRQSGSWGGVDVCSPFAMMERGGVSYFRGCGAWELAAVYGYGKFDDFAPNTKYGNDHEIGLALNWYWNSQVKWSLNYIHQYSDLKNRTNNGADIKTLKAHTDILGVSCRVAF